MRDLLPEASFHDTRSDRTNFCTRDWRSATPCMRPIYIPYTFLPARKTLIAAWSFRKLCKSYSLRLRFLVRTNVLF
jgi:hypothetical protein